jgi:hypothetical protein
MTNPGRGVAAASIVFCVSLCGAAYGAGSQPAAAGAGAVRDRLDTWMFAPSSDCLACHNGLVGPAGDDLSIGASWRGTMMANAARDPYVRASVRRETIDHRSSAADIEDECAACHLPAARNVAHAAGQRAAVFAHFAPSGELSALDVLARDGVTCTVCHQIAADRLGTRNSFNGNFTVATPNANGRRRAFGPFAPNSGRRQVMHSVTGFEQEQAPHIRESELCASCHTLITQARGPRGQVIGSLPEQMNYQEWRHSAFFGEQRSCQSCHMPSAPGPVRVASVLGEARDSLARHTFVGGNAFMLRLMNRYRSELDVKATASELEATARATIRQLETDTATVAIERAVVDGGLLTVDVVVSNLTGHKFPTGYPSRRAWLHLTVRGADGQPLFESGRVADTGSIEGNDADASATAFEPHYTEITQPDQVQIYESIMGTPAGVPTTGLLQATQYLKDNRLLPRGFDKRTADADIAVIGGAGGDADFTGGSDRIRYRVAVTGPVSIEVELRYQPIGFRWARNLAPYDAPEPAAFVRYFDSLARYSSVTVTRAVRTFDPPRASALSPSRSHSPRDSANDTRQ